jgi:tetratricopeptide (TPR) repeat protein
MRLVIVLLATCVTAHSQQHILHITVKDIDHSSLKDIQLSPVGRGDSSSLSQSDGRCRMKLPDETQPGELVTLQVSSAPYKYVIVWPLSQEVSVPPWSGRSKNGVEVVLAKAGDIGILQNGQVILAMTVRVLHLGNPSPTNEKTPGQEDLHKALLTVAGEFGLKPDDVDLAIRSFKSKPKSKDTLEAGLANLYQEKYNAATTLLSEALESRVHALGEAQRQVSEAAHYLGIGYFRQKQYDLAEKAFQTAVEATPKDSENLDYLASTLEEEKKYPGAEAIYAREIAAMTGGEDYQPEGEVDEDIELYKVYVSIARVQEAQGKYSAAESNLTGAYD